MTIEEKLEPYKDNEQFCMSYLDCEPIENIEGLVIENGTWCGYAISDNYGHRWFTDEGIRGVSRGTFYIKNGRPIDLIPMPEYETILLIARMLEKGMKPHQISRNWYDEQTSKYQN